MRKPYPKYKSLPNSWLEQLPTQWGYERISSAFTERRETVSDKDFAPLSVTKNGILPQLETAAKTDNGDNRKRVVKGDFVINSRSDRKGSAGVSPYDGSISVINTVLKPIKGKTDAKYTGYLLTNYYFQEEFYRYGKGIVDDLWSTKFSEMKTMRIPLPTPPEQTQIANFLDHKCTQIDTALQKKTRLIELLKEQKQAIINRAVTRGLDPNVPLKDTGIEWLGEVPAHWDVKKLKYLCRVNQTTLGEDTPQDFTFSYIDISSVDENGTIKSPTHEVFKNAPSRARRVVKRGDVIVSTVRTYLKAIAFFPDYIENLIVSTGFAVLTPNNSILPFFLNFAIRIDGILDTITAHSTGIAYPAITANKLSGFEIPVPPLPEQQQIVKFINEESKTIDTTITRIEREIDLIKEYKTALIAEAVTGKIDVRDWKPDSKTENQVEHAANL